MPPVEGELLSDMPDMPPPEPPEVLLVDWQAAVTARANRSIETQRIRANDICLSIRCDEETTWPMTAIFPARRRSRRF